MDDKEHQWHDFPQLPKLTVLPWLLWALIGLTAIWATWAYAEPIARTEGNGVVVTVYTEPCQLKEVVNLPQRATWEERGQTIEGCAGMHPAGAVMFYFADKTVVIHPMSAFVSVTGV